MRVFLLLLLSFLFLFATSNTDFKTNYLSQEQIKFLNEHSVIRVSNEKHWAPYDYNENGEPKGYAIDYLKLISKKLGVKFVFVTDSWKNLITKVKDKEIDIIHPLAINEKRKEFLNFTAPFIQNIHTLITRKDSDIKSLDDLAGKRIAVVKGWNTTRFLKENYKDAIFIEVASSKDLVQAVAFGEADACIDGYLTVSYFKQKYFLNNIQFLSRVITPKLDSNLYIGVRKDWDMLVDILQIAMRHISEKEILELNKNWIDDKNIRIKLNKTELDFLEKHHQIKIRVSEDYYPFSFVSNNSAKGYVIDYTNLLAQKLGIDFKYVRSETWGKAIEDFKNKKVDVLPMMKFTEDRKNIATFTTPILETFVGLAVNKDELSNVSFEKLNGKKLAIVDGYWYNENIKKYYKDIKTIKFKSNFDALLALKEKKVDAVISTEAVLQYLIKENYFVGLSTKPILNNKYFEKTLGRYAIRKDWEIFKNIMQKAMDSVSDEDNIQLKRKWFGENTKENKIELTNAQLEYISKNNTINICVNSDWYPYEEINNSEISGISSEYLNILNNLLPIKNNLIPTKNQKESLEYLNNGNCDAISFISSNTNNEFINLTKPYLELPLIIITKVNKPFISELTQVDRKKVAVLDGYNIIDNLKQKYPNINFIEVSSMEEGLNEVVSNKVYGYIDTLLATSRNIQENFLGSLKVAGKFEDKVSISLAVNSTNEKLYSIYNKAISLITQEQKKEISNKWISLTYEIGTNYKYLWNILIVASVVFLFFLYRQSLLKRQNQKLIRTQKRLESSLEEFESLLNSTLEAIFIFKDKKCIKANEEAVRLLKYDNEQELLNVDLRSLTTQEFHKQVERNMDSKITSIYEAKGVKKDGETFPVLVRGKDFIFRNETVRLVVVMDLTDLKHKEKLLTEHTKMVALGEMIGNIAHQWRQPLSVISTAASGVKMQKEMDILTDKLFFESMDGIVESSKYLSKTIDDFRGFLSNNKTKVEFELETHIEKVLSILNPMLKLNNIEVYCDFEKGLKVESFANELTQVFINILTNAKDKFVEDELEKRFIFIKTYALEQKKCIEIKDNAKGIREDIIDKIFEPYFTTKHKNQGTGLGLYMTNEIITKSLKGTITAKNVEYKFKDTKQKGALFLICL